MPDHMRKRIRAAVKTAVTDLTTTEDRVFLSPPLAIEAASLPCLCIYSEEGETEGVEEASMGDELEREYRYAVEGLLKLDGDIDDALDQIALEVEAAVAGAGDLGGLVIRNRLVSTRITRSPDGDVPHGAISLVYAALYETGAADAGEPL